MKKTLISATAAMLCACTLTVSAFAEDVLTDRSVYAENGKELAQAAGSRTYDGKTFYPDPDTIIPVYTFDIYDYARTGNFEIKPSMSLDGNGSETDGQWHISNIIDENGNFAGTMDLIFGGENSRIVSLLLADRNRVEPVAFEPNAKRISALMKERGLSTDCKEIKFLSVEGVGNVYYIDNGSEKLLAASNIGDVNARIFNKDNGGIIVIGEELKAAAEVELAERTAFEKEYEKLLESWDPTTPPPTIGGYETPTYKVDNTPYLNGGADTDITPNPVPNTGSTAQGVTSVIALGALTAAAVTVVKRRKEH